jgi:hypothetical protein
VAKDQAIDLALHLQAAVVEQDPRLPQAVFLKRVILLKHQDNQHDHKHHLQHKHHLKHNLLEHQNEHEIHFLVE